MNFRRRRELLSSGINSKDSSLAELYLMYQSTSIAELTRSIALSLILVNSAAPAVLAMPNHARYKICEKADIVLQDKASLDKFVTTPFELVSSDFGDGRPIPKRCTQAGENLSPDFIWSIAPPRTKSLALSCEDQDAPDGARWHWIVFNIPPSWIAAGEDLGHQYNSLSLPPKLFAAAEENGFTPRIRDGVKQGINDFNTIGYSGPVSTGGKKHRYKFKLKALDTVLNLETGCNKTEFLSAVKGHIISEKELTGMYAKK